MPNFLVTERGKEVEHSVWLMSFTLENLKRLWDKSKTHRILFDDDINGDFDLFCNIFFAHNGDNIIPKGLVYIMDDFTGMVFISNITSRECSVHFSFFDGRLRYEVAREMLKFIFEEYDFERLNTTVVPFGSRYLYKFVETMGFVREGAKRKALLYKDEKFDLYMYGLIRDEFFSKEEKWDTMKEQLVEAQPSS